jgi:hypothetical protein
MSTKNITPLSDGVKYLPNSSSTSDFKANTVFTVETVYFYNFFDKSDKNAISKNLYEYLTAHYILAPSGIGIRCLKAVLDWNGLFYSKGPNLLKGGLKRWGWDWETEIDGVKVLLNCPTGSLKNEALVKQRQVFLLNIGLYFDFIKTPEESIWEFVKRISSSLGIESPPYWWRYAEMCDITTQYESYLRLEESLKEVYYHWEQFNEKGELNVNLYNKKRMSANFKLHKIPFLYKYICGEYYWCHVYFHESKYLCKSDYFQNFGKFKN